jgi:CheY-like chemotaxis protein
MNTVAMLEDLGHTVTEASSGAQALSLLRDKRIDLVITDQAMPNMTSAELIKE